MDYDSYFSSPRWKVLEIIARKPSSPLEISREMGTSVSYVSQQLKLLEAANLVVKKKTGMADRGQPRNVYSLSGEMLYFTSLVEGRPAKRMIYLTEHHKLILRIWLLDDSSKHHYLEKFYWEVERDLKDIKGIFVEPGPKYKVIVVSDSKKLKQKVESFFRENSVLDYLFLPDAGKIDFGKVEALYDPGFLGRGKELKGGNAESE